MGSDGGKEIVGGLVVDGLPPTVARGLSADIPHPAQPETSRRILNRSDVPSVLTIPVR